LEDLPPGIYFRPSYVYFLHAADPPGALAGVLKKGLAAQHKLADLAALAIPAEIRTA
jgi:hypothetical protein